MQIDLFTGKIFDFIWTRLVYSSKLWVSGVNRLIYLIYELCLAQFSLDIEKFESCKIDSFLTISISIVTYNSYK